MRLHFSQPRSHDDVRIDLTPLIDVVLQLLIFFMLSTTFITAPGIKVRLPEASSKEISEEKAEINLIISEEGKSYLGERALSENDLSREFRAAFERDPNTTVILRADRRVAHGKVVRVMDLARRAQLRRLAIATEKGNQPDDKN